MPNELDNPAWSALTTFQSHVARGGTLAKRYPEDVAQIAAVSLRNREALEELAALIPAGEWLSLPATIEGLTPLMPSHLKITMEKRLVQMVRENRSDGPERGIEISMLSEADAPAMVALAEITNPGPFRTRTYTTGTYLGIRAEGRLAAMAGQRMHLPGYREISAVCTHPDFQGRGYARALVARLVTAIREEGLTPFLHVEEANVRALALYAGLGFVERKRLPLLVIERA